MKINIRFSLPFGFFQKLFGATSEQHRAGFGWRTAFEKVKSLSANLIFIELFTRSQLIFIQIWARRLKVYQLRMKNRNFNLKIKVVIFLHLQQLSHHRLSWFVLNLLQGLGLRKTFLGQQNIAWLHHQLAISTKQPEIEFINEIWL